jgi:hypothetical protein
MPELISGTEGNIQNELLHLVGGGADQTELQLKVNTAASW